MMEKLDFKKIHRRKKRYLVRCNKCDGRGWRWNKNNGDIIFCEICNGEGKVIKKAIRK